MDENRISIIGAGYVGLTTALAFAEKGFKINIYDIDSDKIKNINNGTSYYYEPRLDDLLTKHVNNGSLVTSPSLKSLLKSTDIVFICVGTPTNDKGFIDLSFLEKVCIEIGDFLHSSNNYITIIIKSTVVPTTTDTFVLNTIRDRSNKKLGKFGLGMVPEFLREGSAIEDALNPDRIVIGYELEDTKTLLTNLFSKWNCEKIFVNTRTAEIIKYTNNALLALLISTANEISNLTRQIGGIDFSDIFDGIKHDRRWNTKDNDSIYPDILKYFKPGPGFGGSCFPKDVKALLSFGEINDSKMEILRSIVSVNLRQHIEIKKILVERSLLSKNNKLLILGLSFKENTDDIRNSKSIELINLLYDKVELYAHDPLAIKNTISKLKDKNKINYIKDWKSILFKIDIVILMTNWNEYKSINLHDIKDTKLFIDSRNFLDNNNFKKLNNYITL